jgi:hypothetical protein
MQIPKEYLFDARRPALILQSLRRTVWMPMPNCRPHRFDPVSPLSTTEWDLSAAVRRRVSLTERLFPVLTDRTALGDATSLIRDCVVKNETATRCRREFQEVFTTLCPSLVSLVWFEIENQRLLAAWQRFSVVCWSGTILVCGWTPSRL